MSAAAKLCSLTALALLFAVGCGKSAADLTKEAAAAQKEGKFREAVALYTEALALEPKNDAVYVNRAACYGGLKETHNMLSDAEMAVDINPKNVAALELLADHWHNLGNQDAAQKTAENLLKADPDNAVAKRILRR